jgi:chromatin assembly factor 1 subunit A
MPDFKQLEGTGITNDFSDKSIAALCKSIKQQLLPEALDDALKSASSIDRLPNSCLERAVLNVAERINYGADLQHTPSSSNNKTVLKVPTGLCIWRWEAKERSLLPAQIQEKAESRRNERLAAKKELGLLIDSLNEQQRLALFGVKDASLPAPPDAVIEKEIDVILVGSQEPGKEVRHPLPIHRAMSD